MSDDSPKRHLYFSFVPVIAANVFAEVTGIDPLDHIAILELIAAASVIGEPAIDLIHPAGEVAYIELIEIIDPLNTLSPS